MSFYVDCVSCGKQTLVDGEPGERCLFCGEPVSSPVQRILSEIINKKEVSMQEKPVKSKPEKRKRRREYFEQNKEAMLADYYLLPIGEFLKKWALSSTTWVNLKRKWNVVSKNTRLTGTPILRDVKLPSPHDLTEHERYLVLLGYQMAVREFLKEGKIKASRK